MPTAPVVSPIDPKIVARLVRSIARELTPRHADVLRGVASGEFNDLPDKGTATVAEVLWRVASRIPVRRELRKVAREAYARLRDAGIDRADADDEEDV